MKIGCIGTGAMGGAIMRAVCKKYDVKKIKVTDKNTAMGQKFAAENGCAFAATNAQAVKDSKYIFLAVKPQFYPQVLKNIENVVRNDQVIISIAPGITMDYLKKTLGIDKRFVRVMPNTPALIGCGMTGVCFDDNDFDYEEKEVIDMIFTSFGRYRRVDERLMSAVTCASGSSPAYVYMFIEALADSAVKYGMPRDMAYEMVAQTVMGSAKMVLETKEHPGKLKDNVCSPAGTTIAGVSALEEFGFRNAIIKATDECYKKCEGL